MIRIKKAFESLSKEDYNKLLDLPIWLSLLAAYNADGRVSEHERAEAVKLAHLRTFTGPKSLRDFYIAVDRRFNKRFDELNSRLPDSQRNKELYIEAQIKACHAVLAILDPDVAETLEENLESFYTHIFRAENSIFQYFALPVISSRLEKKSGHYNLSPN
jgi:hypothetical protein